jgi:hypothetical protein
MNKQDILAGIPSHDKFKMKHMDLANNLYATDLDLVLVSHKPRKHIVAFLDFKSGAPEITWSEAVAYEVFLNIAPVYLACGDPGTGKFEIFSITRIWFEGLVHCYETRLVAYPKNWKEYEKWEMGIREGNSQSAKGGS